MAVKLCDLCNLKLAPSHPHLLDVATREIANACEACGLRFQSVVGGRFKLIPRYTRALPGFCLTGAQWESLVLPINLAFFFQDSTGGKITAMYPSPTGATEFLLSHESWEALAVVNPALVEMEPDVEALLVNRVAGAREYFIAPIDRCHELAGLIRANWRGLSGGDTLWEKTAAYFAKLRREIRRTSELTEVHHA